MSLFDPVSNIQISQLILLLEVVLSRTDVLISKPVATWYISHSLMLTVDFLANAFQNVEIFFQSLITLQFLTISVCAQ